MAGIHIPFEARIVRVADAFDAITHTRPYQTARSVEDALAELDRWSGRQFDPELVRLLVALIRGQDQDLLERERTPRSLPIERVA